MYTAFEAIKRQDASTQTEGVFIISALSTPIRKQARSTYLTTPIMANSSGYEASSLSPQLDSEANSTVSCQATLIPALVILVSDSDDLDKDINNVYASLAGNPASNGSCSPTTLSPQAHSLTPIYMSTPELKNVQMAATELHNHYDIYGQYEAPQTADSHSHFSADKEAGVRVPDNGAEMPGNDKFFDTYSEFDWEEELEQMPELV